MPRLRTRLVLGIALLSGASATGAVAQGAWVQPKGAYYFQIESRVLSTEREFDFGGDEQSIFADDSTRTDGSFRDVTISSYIEFGLSRDFTLVASVPFKIVTSNDTRLPALPGERARRSKLTNGGLGDVRVAIRTPLIREPLAVALQIGVKLPLGYEQEPDNNGPPLGTGELDAEAFLAAGQSLYPLPLYVMASAGYRVRGGVLHDEILYAAEVGFDTRRWFAKLRIEGIANVVDPPEIVIAPDGDASDVIVGDQDLLMLMPALSFKFTETFALGAQLFHSLAGKDIVAGTTYTIDLVWTRP